MARSPVTDVIQRYNALTDEQQKLFLDMVDPEPEPEAPKQTRKKRGKSQRASGMAEAIKGSIERGKEPLCGVCGNKKSFDDHQPGSPNYHEFDSGKSATADGADEMCGKQIGDMACGLPHSNPLHHDTVYAQYHKFEAPKSSAPVAAKRSSRKSASTPSTPSIENEAENVSAVGASAGD